MEQENVIELEECPICRGEGILMYEGGWNVQVECVDCGSHTVYLEYNSPEERTIAEKNVASLWNMGKVINTSRGE